MPTYEYRCPDGHDFEKFVLKISDAKSELTCPECGKVATRRMSAGGGLLFKGSGFYITDYGKDGKKDQRVAAKKDGTSEGGAAGSAPAPAAPAASTPATPAAPAPAPAAPAKPEKAKKKPGSTT